MKSINKIIILFLLASMGMTGCDNFERTEVEYTISVDQPSLSMFPGDETVLIASPAEDGDFAWQSEDTEVATVSNGTVKAIGIGMTNILVSKNGITHRVPVTVITKVPLTDVKLSPEKMVLFIDATATATPTLVPIDANDFALMDFAWWTEDPSIATVRIDGVVSGIKEGNTTLFYRKGSITKSISVDVSTTLPFNGPHIISKNEILILPLRDFDMGGEGNAFHDSDNVNSGGGDGYRRNGGDNNSLSVDINMNNGFFNIGWTGDGEWLLYTVEVEDAGTYAVQVGASGGSNGAFHLELDGATVDNIGSVPIPSNGSWSNWQWFPATPVELTLTEGKHKIKFFIETAGFNCTELKFEFLR